MPVGSGSKRGFADLRGKLTNEWSVAAEKKRQATQSQEGECKRKWVAITHAREKVGKGRGAKKGRTSVAEAKKQEVHNNKVRAGI